MSKRYDILYSPNKKMNANNFWTVREKRILLRRWHLSRKEPRTKKTGKYSTHLISRLFYILCCWPFQLGAKKLVYRIVISIEKRTHLRSLDAAQQYKQEKTLIQNVMNCTNSISRKNVNGSAVNHVVWSQAVDAKNIRDIFAHFILPI